MNDFKSVSPSKMISNINLVFFALFSGQIFYLLAGLFLLQSGSGQGISGVNTIFMFIIPVVNVCLILAAKFIYEKNLSRFNKTLPLESKSQSYQINNIIKLALLEGANIINISAMIITSNYFFAALFVIIIALFLLNKPAKEKFIMEYEVASDDVIKVLG
ncbi:MAG: hypothetical protein WAV89_07530 [Ignavibacteriaceae bacterium]